MAPHSSILAWRTPVDRGAWQAMGTGCDSIRMQRDIKCPLLEGRPQGTLLDFHSSKK